MGPFRPGDRVRCNDDQGTPSFWEYPNDHIRLDEVYTVRGTGTTPYSVDILEKPAVHCGETCFYDGGRFELVTSRSIIDFED